MSNGTDEPVESNDTSLDFVSEESEERLNHRQAIEYNEHRRRLVEWLESEGKDPEHDQGYAAKTAANYASRIDGFYRWVWSEYHGYSTNLTQEHADAYVEQLRTDELRKENGNVYAESTKRKNVDAVRVLFDWRAARFGDEPWRSDVSFSDNTYNAPDVFTVEERDRLRDAVLEYDTIPAYGDLSPEERDRWKAYLAQKFGKSKSDVSPSDWDRVNRSWKVPSLVWTSLDAGLRPIEVERATVSWPRTEKATLYIPKEESSKNRDNWEVALQPKTARTLARWIEERENYTKYDGRDALWLNNQANPYSSRTLNYLLRNLMETAGIDQENRQLTWYSIRHSVGTYMASKGTLAEAQEQLRHASLDSTLQYTHPSVEDRQDTLDKMG